MTSEPEIVVAFQSKNEQLVERYITAYMSGTKSADHPVVGAFGLGKPFCLDPAVKLRESLRSLAKYLAHLETSRRLHRDAVLRDAPKFLLHGRLVFQRHT